MKKIKLLFLLLPILQFTPLFAQAGKVDGSALRLKFALLSGFYNSDWENRNQSFQLFYNRVLEDNWKDKNKAYGGKLGVDYFAPLKNSTFTHLLFGASYSMIHGGFPMARYGSGELQTGKYTGGYNSLELTFGTVINAYEGLRVIPKFVHRSLVQNLKNKVDTYYFSDTTVGLLNGTELYKSNAALGYLGLGLEYDITPTLTVYFDSLLFSNFLIQSNGKYQVDGSAQGFLLSNSSAVSMTRLDHSQGNYKVSGNRFLLGFNLKITDSFRFFIATEKDSIVTEISNPIGSNVLGLLSLSSRSTFAVQGDAINKTIYEMILYTGKQRIESTTLQLGVAKDISF